MPTKTFPTLHVASVLTGITMADGVTITQMQEIASHLFGAYIFPHELGHEPTMEAVQEEGYRQFPDMPTREQGLVDWGVATAKAVVLHGWTVEVEQGTHGRREHPADTFVAVSPDMDLIVVQTE